MNYNKVEIFNILKEILKVQFSDIKVLKKSNFKIDFQADELDMVEIVMEIEDEFDLSINDKKADKWKTVENILTYLYKELDIKEPINSRFEILDIR